MLCHISQPDLLPRRRPGAARIATTTWNRVMLTQFINQPDPLRDVLVTLQSREVGTVQVFGSRLPPPLTGVRLAALEHYAVKRTTRNATD